MEIFRKMFLYNGREDSSGHPRGSPSLAVFCSLWPFDRTHIPAHLAPRLDVALRWVLEGELWANVLCVSSGLEHCMLPRELPENTVLCKGSWHYLRCALVPQPGPLLIGMHATLSPVYNVCVTLARSKPLCLRSLRLGEDCRCSKT